MLELEQLAEPRKSNLLALAGRRRPTALIPLGYGLLRQNVEIWYADIHRY